MSITIDPSGVVKLAVNGVCGPQCKNLTRDIENAIGKTVSSVPTAEFNQAQNQQAGAKAVNRA